MHDWLKTSFFASSGLPPLGSGDSDEDSFSEEEDEADEDSNGRGLSCSIVPSLTSSW